MEKGKYTMNQQQEKDIILTLIRAGKETLAKSFAHSRGYNVKPIRGEIAEPKWDDYKKAKNLSPRLGEAHDDDYQLRQTFRLQVEADEIIKDLKEWLKQKTEESYQEAALNAQAAADVYRKLHDYVRRLGWTNIARRAKQENMKFTKMRTDLEKKADAAHDAAMNSGS